MAEKRVHSFFPLRPFRSNSTISLFGFSNAFVSQLPHLDQGRHTPCAFPPKRLSDHQASAPAPPDATSLLQNSARCRSSFLPRTAGFTLARADRDPTLADGILDRLVHNAHRIEMRRIRCARVEVKRGRRGALPRDAEFTPRESASRKVLWDGRIPAARRPSPDKGA
jgi:hypothetical protein